MDDPIMNENAGQAEGGVVAEAAAAGAAAEAGAQDPIFAEDLEHLTLEQLHSAVEARPDVVRATDAANGWTLLHHAVHLGWEIDMVEYLLEVGPDAAQKRARNNGPLPIHLVNSRTILAVALLLSRTCPEAQHLSYEPRAEGDVPFNCAIKNGASLTIVVLMFLWRYETAFAAGSADPVLENLLSSVQSGERFHAIEERLREFSRDKTSEDGERSLFLALESDAAASVVRFVHWAWPKSIRARDGDGQNPLHYAVLQGASHEVVTLLVKWRPKAARERDDQGCLPIHYVWTFTTRWPNRNDPAWPDAAQALVKVYPESLQQANDAGEIPLHGAARSNLLPLVQFLVEMYPAGVRRRSKDGWLPLHQAVLAAQPVGEQVVPYLVQQWPESAQVTTHDGRTVLHLAAIGPGGPALVDLLVADNESLLRARANDGSLALHDGAAAFEDLATVRRLIDLNPNAVHATMNDELTLLHRVALHKDALSAVNLARILVEHAPDLVRSRSHGGRLPIHWAAKMGPLGLVECLVEFWPESIDCVDDEGLTPLHCASRSQPPEVVRYLADLRPEALAVRNSYGILPLHIAAAHQSSLPSVQVLVESRPEALGVRTTDRLGYLPLHLAVARRDRRIDIAQYLAEKSPGSLQVRTARGALPVELAAWMDASLDVIFVLLTTWPECLMLHRRDSVAVQVKRKSPLAAAEPPEPTVRQSEGLD